MVATAGLSLTLDPMGKMFQNASSLKPLGQVKPNCPGMIIGRSSQILCFYADRKSKMAATAIHRLTLDQGFQSGPVPGTFTRLRSCIVPAEITEHPKIRGGQNHKYDGQ